MTSKSKSKSNGRKSKKLKVVPKSKQPRQVKKPTRNWLELPTDVMANILQRIGVVDILENAQKVCTAWRKICKDPSMWRVIYVDTFSGPGSPLKYQEMCIQAVDRSQGQLVDLSVIGLCTHDFLHYVADRSSQLRRLEVVYFITSSLGIQGEVFKKLSSLEELSLDKSLINKDNIEAIGRYCPLLKTLKLNQEVFRLWNGEGDETMHNEIALAIGEHLPALTHLELIGNGMQNVGLHAILDGCCHLESLDLRGCVYLDLDGDLAKRCSQQIKYLRLPHESLEGYDDMRYVNETWFSLALFPDVDNHTER